MAMPMSAMAISHRLIRPRMLSTSSSDRPTWIAKPRSPAGRFSTRRCVPGGARILVERLVDLAACGRTCPRRHRDLRGRVGRGDDLAVGEDDLSYDGDATERFARQAKDLGAGRAADSNVERRCALLQRLVDLAAKLVPHERIRDRRGADDRHGDGRSGGERQPGTEAHVSRRA